MSDRLLAIQLSQTFSTHNNIKKVKLSMSRLLTVVNERKKLRNEYRKFLETQYIEQKKKEELREKLLKVM